MNTNFSVPNPCHENWDAMKPESNGRYCDSCKKVVIDFTNKSNEEIADYLLQNSGKKLCGTFKNAQLPPSHHNRQHKKTIRFLAAVLLVFGMTLFSCESIDLGDKPPAEDYSNTILTGVMVLPPVVQVKGKICPSGNAFAPPQVVDKLIECPQEPRTIGSPKLKHDTIRVKKNQDEPLTIADKMPEFPGGVAKMMQYISKNIQYPRKCSEMGIQGTVFLAFIVKKDGTLTDIKIIKGVHEELDKVALEVVKQMPTWTPGENKGKVVSVRCNLPIRFRL